MQDCETNDCRKEKMGCKGCFYENGVTINVNVNSREELLKWGCELLEKINNLKEYATWHRKHLTETIADYIYDDKNKNANIIGELKEEREYWRDIIRIIENKETYIDYKGE